MWQSENNAVEDYLDKSPVISSKSLVLAEWNLNNPENIFEIGNYRYRPNEYDTLIYNESDEVIGVSSGSPYTFPKLTIESTSEISTTYPNPNFVKEDSETENPFYFGATDSDVVVDGGYLDNDVPVTFISQKEKNKRLFSLEACLDKFRPRSGINKAVYFPGRFINKSDPEMSKQPRYYMPSVDDKFKYWTSYRTEGVSVNLSADITAIDASETATDTEILVYGQTTKITAINGFSAGDVVTISGTASHNGTFLIVSASSTSFKILDKSETPLSAETSGLGSAEAVVIKDVEKVRGLSDNSPQHIIDDTAPFVVYKDMVPANRLIIKMQTNVGSIDLGPYINEQTGESFDDPLYGYSNATIPSSWKIQYLNNSDVWTTMYDTMVQDFIQIESDGYVELAYGLIVPETTTNIVDVNVKDIIVFAGELASPSALPAKAPRGYAWLVTDGTTAGDYYIFNGEDNPDKMDNYDTFAATYEWYINDQIPTRTSNYASNLTDPKKFGISEYTYREFQYIKGIRIVIDNMRNSENTFDLIEVSPRLAVDLSDRTKSFSINKHLSDLGESGLPVGQILSSTGELSLFDYDQAFNPNNTDSIVASLSNKNLQIKFYEEIIDGSEFVYFIPLKTMYADGFPETSPQERSFNIQLKDQFSFIESLAAPQMLIPDCSLSVAVSILLDSIGFSNYTFKRIGKNEPRIPYFFIAPETTIAEVLEDLARSTQTAMFFDEYNNLVLMTKEYMMPTEDERATDITLIGSETYKDKPSVYSNMVKDAGEGFSYEPSLANISGISTQDDEIFNDGKIVYTTRYIQRETPNFKQALSLDSQKTWVYKPVLLWEVSPEQTTKSWNDEVSTQSAYSLAAIPLSNDLSNTVPSVSNGSIINNIMDLGESVYWLSRYNGYFYANGEIIRFDAVEYNAPSSVFTIDITKDGDFWTIGTADQTKFSKIKIGQEISGTDSMGLTFPEGTTIISASVNKGKYQIKLSNAKTSTTSTGTVEVQSPSNIWITDVQEYQAIFSTLPFGGKIYPTGRVRIYAEPYYDSTTTTGLKNGAVSKHGRGQFGTKVTSHTAGLEGNYWSQASSIKNCYMKSSYIFNGGTIPPTYKNNSSAGVLSSDSILVNGKNIVIPKATTNGLIKNFLSNSFTKEAEINKIDTTIKGTIQSSALVFSGPSYPAQFISQDFISYIPKVLDESYVSYGTRLRIIGSIENSDVKTQTPNGSMSYYSLQKTDNSNANVGGASGGLAFWLDSTTNNGYYFEIAALTDNNINSYTSSKVNNVFFYKVRASANGTAIPILLWSGFTNILVDDGNFTGQNRLAAEENPTVYDLGVEYDSKGLKSAYRFYLSINGKRIATVIDKDPMPKKTTIAPFIRGSSRVMFENLYALTTNYAQNNSALTKAPVSSVFSQNSMSYTGAFSKYGMPNAIQSTFLSGLSSKQNPEYLLYYEEFGTIMREMDYFNIRYDKAYPALFAKLSPTFNSLQGYTVSGFAANSYGAEFLIFNISDGVVNLDDTSGNYLRIQGVTFTQESEHTLTVDDYFQKNSNLSDPQLGSDGKTINVKTGKQYLNIKQSRMEYGKKEFVLDAPYIQTQDDANILMDWITSKIMQPRKSIGLNIFSMPTLQLGDIVKINYVQNEVNQVSQSLDDRFVIYSIDYTRNEDGPEMTVYLSEVK